MKRDLSLSTLFLASAALMSSCSTEDPAPTTVREQISNNVTESTWRVSRFNDSGTDETSHFTGYAFTFSNGGGVQAVNGSAQVNGSWSITDSNTDDDTQDDLNFVLDFDGTNADFDDLSDDWDFISQTETMVKLVSVSGGNGGTDSLTFVRN